MEDLKHTPGPWDITYTSDGKMALINDAYVCSVELDDRPEGEANAKLIMAAPELLKACERYMEILKEHYGDMPVFMRPITNNIEAAIKKAKGL